MFIVPFNVANVIEFAALVVEHLYDGRPFKDLYVGGGVRHEPGSPCGEWKVGGGKLNCCDEERKHRESVSALLAPRLCNKSESLHIL